jgi:peroxiredoxin
MSQTTIAAGVTALHERMSQQPPSEGMSAFAREQQALARVTPTGVITVGERLTDARLLDVHGTDTTLRATVGEKPAVLVFYRGAWCPYCNIALRTYQAELVDELDVRGVRLIAVSPQKPDGSLTMQEKHGLRFAVLSDPGSTLLRDAGILTAPSPDARAAQLELGLDLEAVNADGTTTLPMPTTLIIDPDLTVRWVDVHPDYSSRTEPADILEALDEIQA